MFCTIVFLLAQVVDHPAPLKTLVEIAPLYEQLRSLDVLMPAVAFIHVLPISEQAGINQAVDPICYDPEAVRQMSVDGLIRGLDHPIVVLPFEEKV